ncbi:MAG: response regulator [Lachnospiraceae bacterium]|nr:response regulator [Lachnospiraceae bacterium]
MLKRTEFTLTLIQEVAGTEKIGKIKISGNDRGQSGYSNLFRDPDATILIVDDSKVNLSIETGLLRDTGLQIDTAFSGLKALEMTLKKRYDCILLDHLMPEMDGIECLKQIRTQKDGMCTDVPVVILTANAERENQDMYAEAGFDGYLVKPVSGNSLEEELIKHIPKDKLQ